MVASKPAVWVYVPPARHIVDERPGGRAAPAPQHAVFDRAHSVADRPVVDRRHQIARQLSQARALRWIVEIARRQAFEHPVVADDHRIERGLHELQHVRRMNAEGQMDRSEEHTSELQSLMRISYAVFCLKKQNKKI